ncbi:hypothetical protein [Clostridium estertheticum]|uniref:hypothetical protein n=1 Tax=Clostridium estertheticum TaxID=238834 RepID=UPI001CF15526|nr:hypothetical protein [Clostridium estertheticum]MCB2362004.1 hypothetical protein [Clostridium estertheticum]
MIQRNIDSITLKELKHYITKINEETNLRVRFIYKIESDAVDGRAIEMPSMAKLELMEE